MDSIKTDPRFAHIASDPRFRPMPKSKKKVKIDGRFQSLFTRKDFSHRTDMDKRGRPVLDVSKKRKHVMERFYELSDSEEDGETDDPRSSDQDHSESEEAIKSFSKEKMKKNSKATTKKFAQDLKISKKKHVKESLKKLKENSSNSTDKASLLTKNRKRKPADNDDDQDSVSNKKKTKQTTDEKKSVTSKFKSLKQKEPSYTSEDDASDEDDVTSDDDMTDNEKEQASSASDDDYGNESDKEEDELPIYTQEYELEETDVDHQWNELHKDAPIVSEATHRFAVCNMDWDHVKARDLFVLFKSFAPEGGSVKSVTIFPSEYGKERMAEEAMLGPREIRDSAHSDGEHKNKGKGQKKGKVDQQKKKVSEMEKNAAHTEKLREYQLNRLRYYYAVVNCDSVRTADTIYNECDGREYLLSAVRLDLRFIPDDMVFDEEPKEQFSEKETVLEYQPSEFLSTALSQAKVEVTWDETEFDRLRKKVKTMQQKELENLVEENKFSDIIAPPESDSEDGDDERPDWLKKILDTEDSDNDDGGDRKSGKKITEEERISMYRKVLMDKIEEEKEHDRKEEEGDLDIEVEWQPGLKSAVEKKLKKKEKKADDNAIVGEYLDKKKEKKKKKKADRLKKLKEANKEESNEDADAFSDDDIPEGFDKDEIKELLQEDGFVSKSSKKIKNSAKKRKASKSEEQDMSEKERAQLELIMMDNDGVKKISKPEVVKEEGNLSKKKRKKLNKLAKLKKTEKDKEDFALDLNDPRFSALYSSHHFHIDPSAPQFRKTKNMLKLVDEQIKRKGVKKAKSPAVAEDVQQSNTTKNNKQTKNSKSVSQSLVESLKRKMRK